MNGFELLFRYMFSERSVSLVRRLAWVSVLSVTLGVLFFVVISSVMKGMNQSIAGRILALEPHYELLFSPAHGEPKTHPVFEEFLLQKEQVGLAGAIGERQEVILRSAKGTFRGARAWGVSEISWEQIQKRTQAIQNDGRNDFLDWTHAERPGPGEVDMGADLARSAGLFEGDVVTLISPESLLLPDTEVPIYVTVRIRNIITTSLTELDTQIILYGSGTNTLSALSGNPSYHKRLELWLNDPFQAPNLIDLARFHGLEVQDWRKRHASLFFALKMERIFIGLFLILGSLVAGLSIITVLILLVSHKKREMGILMTMGLSRKQLRWNFITMGGYLGGGGVVLGVFLGLLISGFLILFPLSTMSDVYFDSSIPVRIDWRSVLLILICGLLLVFLTSYLVMRSFGRLQVRSLFADGVR